ncbi:unnamed protein product [Darwinula stevensoni]|uniref:Amino acid transporter n=1 Tax=Darwinula stevensoni TaxID=69355 RepID=A0A7R8X647_9CRUS|nr:unnamed protein product [Darwinula stevensoni]CAG0886527.1 unnamed protein product [Darwinula stevensoni]
MDGRLELNVTVPQCQPVSLSASSFACPSASGSYSLKWRDGKTMSRLPKWRKVTKKLRQNLLLIVTVVGVFTGVILGFGLRTLEPSRTTILVISYPGEIFMRLLRLMILPLVISSLVSGSASLNAKMNGKIAMRTIAWFLATSFLNAIIGTLLAIAIRPGWGLSEELASMKPDRKDDVSILDSFLDLGRLTPVGVACIICGKILEMKDVSMIVSQLGLFIAAVLIGVFLYQWIILQLFYLLLVRKNPLPFYFGLAQPWLIAFATASTYELHSPLDSPDWTGVMGDIHSPPGPWRYRAVALPVTLKCMDKMRIDHRVTRFVLPIGATVNMDGTALFVSIASIFIAQMTNVPLGIGDYVTVVVTSTAVSVAAASVPSAALVLMLMVLGAIDVPSENVSLLFTIDWFVDRFRTTNNMLGDCYTAAIVEHYSRNELPPDKTHDPSYLQNDQQESKPLNRASTEDIEDASLAITKV